MAYCKKCGKQLADDAAFCSACGVPIIQIKENASSSREERYDGVIHKCPNCGERLESFVSKCPACGFELRGVEASNRVNDLATKLEEAEDAVQRNDLIRNFYIPNTKEDIYEFFILATSNIEAGGDNVDAWYAKLDQAYKKAGLVLGEGEELARLRGLYEKTGKSRPVKSAFSVLSRSKTLQASIMFAVGVALVVIGFSLGGSLSIIGLIGIFPIGAAANMLSEKSK